MKIAITGANGLIGSRIVELLDKNFTFVTISHQELDITDKDQVKSKFEKLDYDLLLHLAAYTNVDRAEEEKNIAHDINVNGTKNLLNAVMENNRKMIYLSTDFVFDGKNPPYDETSIPNPVGYYGKSKYEAEKIVLGKAMIVRISYPYGKSPAQKPDFVQKIRKLLEKNTKLKMVTDSKMTPTHIDDITFGLRYLMENFKPELQHLVGSKTYSPYEAGLLIAKRYKLDPKLIDKTTFQEYSKGKSPRPQNSEIISRTNHFHKMKSFEEGLKEC